MQWIERTAGTHRGALEPAVRVWLEAFGRGVVQRYAHTTAALKARMAEPIDPNHPMAEILRGARERNAGIMAMGPPVE